MTYERLRLNDGCTDQYVLYCYTPKHNVAQFPARCFDDPSLIISNKEDENDGAEDKSGQRQDVENDGPRVRTIVRVEEWYLRKRWSESCPATFFLGNFHICWRSE